MYMFVVMPSFKSTYDVINNILSRNIHVSRVHAQFFFLIDRAGKPKK